MKNTLTFDAFGSEDAGDSARIPYNGKGFLGLEDDEEVGHILPDYQDGRYISVGRTLLTLEECYDVLQHMIRRTRLLMFELALRQTPLSLLRGKNYVKLSGPARALDEQLVRWSMNMEGYLNISDDMEQIQTYESSNFETMNVFVRLVESTPEFVRLEAKSKSQIQRMQKQFNQNITEPLKQSLINKKNVINYDHLTKLADKLEEQFRRTAQIHCESVEKFAKDIIKNSAVWAEILRLGRQIDELVEKARQQGWDLDDYDSGSDEEGSRNDDAYREYKQLNMWSVFDTAEGPQKVIAYFERWLAEHPTSTPVLPPAQRFPDDSSFSVDNTKPSTSPGTSHQIPDQSRPPNLVTTTTLAVISSAKTDFPSPGSNGDNTVPATPSKISSAPDRPIDKKKYSRTSSTASRLKHFFGLRKDDSTRA